MEELSVANGSKELLTNGVIIINSSDPTNIKLHRDNEELTIILKFKNTEDKEIKKQWNVLDKLTLEVEFTNYNSVYGHYTKEYWRIGTFKKRALYWSYWIYGMEQTMMKKVEFSFYLGEEVDNG